MSSPTTTTVSYAAFSYVLDALVFADGFDTVVGQPANFDTDAQHFAHA